MKPAVISIAILLTLAACQSPAPTQTHAEPQSNVQVYGSVGAAISTSSQPQQRIGISSSLNL